MGGKSSKPHGATHARIVDVLQKVPFMQMMDAKILDEIATCFQLVHYAKGAQIKSEPWLFLIIAEGSVDISSLLPTTNRKTQHIQEVLCQRKVGDYISFAAREQLLGRLLDQERDGGNPNPTPNGNSNGNAHNHRTARKNLMAMLDLNRITADLFTGCTVLKLHRDRFLRLRTKLETRKSLDYIQGNSKGQGHGADRNHTRRFDDDEEDDGSSSNPNANRARGTSSAAAPSSHLAMRRRSTTITMTRPEKIHLLNSVVESDIVNYLFDIPFLEGVEQSRLVTLSNLCAYTFIKKGDVLCREGDPGDRFFICIRGNLQATIQSMVPQTTTYGTGGVASATATANIQPRGPVIKRLHGDGTTTGAATGDRKIQALKRMGSGAYFGEISLLFKIPRICSITAVDDSLLVYIDRVAFCNFLKIVPEASLVLLEHVRLNFLDTLAKQGCAFLGAIAPLKRQELSYLSDLHEFNVGEQIIAHGAKNTAFYIVLRGEVEVEYVSQNKTVGSSRAAPFAATQPRESDLTTPATDTSPIISTGSSGSGGSDDSVIMPLSPRHDNESEVVRLRPGGYFGHEAIILGLSSSSASGSPLSAKCLDHALLLRLTPERFAQFFGSTPALYAELCIKCLRDKSRPEHIMQHYDAHKLWAADCVSRRRQHELTLFESIEDFLWESEIVEDRLHELALVVYLRFLADNAPLRVQVASHVLEQIEEELSSQQVSATIFAGARAEILTRLEDEHFELFKQSPLFHELLASLYCPQTIYDGLTTAQIAKLDMGAKLQVSFAQADDRRRQTANGSGAGSGGLQLEDVEEESATSFGGFALSFKSAGNRSGRSFGLGSGNSGGPQARYAVAAGGGGGGGNTGPSNEYSQQQATAVLAMAGNNGRRSTRTDVGLQRNLSTSFTMF